MQHSLKLLQEKQISNPNHGLGFSQNADGLTTASSCKYCQMFTLLSLHILWAFLFVFQHLNWSQNHSSFWAGQAQRSEAV